LALGRRKKIAETLGVPWTKKVWEPLLYVIPVGREALWASEPTSGQ